MESPKKVQKASASYTLKAITNNIKKLKELNLITKEEEAQMMELKNKALDKYVKEQFK